MTVIYDLEVLPYFFSYTGKNVDTGQVWQYVISPLRNQLKELRKHLREVKAMVGYNNLGFDSFLIDYLLRNAACGYEHLYELAMQVIEKDDDDRKKTNWKPLIPQLDLYYLHGFHKPVKATSLKWCQFGMNFNNVEDVDFKELAHILSGAEEHKVLSYNLNDVLSTEAFYKKSKDLIDVRKELSVLYNINLMNADEPKLTVELFLELLHRESGLSKEEIKHGRTYRNAIVLKDLILDYIEFNNSETKKVLEFFQSKIIPGDSLKGALEYEATILGIPAKYGLGGIHACTEAGVYSSDNEYVIIDADVTSYYPQLATKNRWSPAHIDTDVFVRLYEGFFRDRQLYAKGTSKNYMYKILLNGTFGKSNEETSFLYDPAYTCKTTINGQLLLTLLAEKLSIIPSLKFLQWNTDGLTARIKRTDKPLYDIICKEWEVLTKLSLEYALYDKMIIRDVNNYISLDNKGKIKSKGMFEYKDMPLNKNKSNAIIAIALEKYFINGVAVETTIRNHDNIFDFLTGVKAKFNSRYEITYSDRSTKRLQKVNRYFICTPSSEEKGRIRKYYEDGRSSLVEAQSCYQKVVNKIDAQYPYIKEVNFNYYIRETKKWIRVIEEKPLTLF